MELTKEQIQKVTDHGLTFHESYSGRFMFGEVTHAVSGNMTQINLFKASLTYSSTESNLDLLRKLDSAKQDELGKGIILY